MWKKQWNKLKTALGTPEEYVEEEQGEEGDPEDTPAEEVEEAAPEYCSDSVISVQPEDLAPLHQSLESLKQLKRAAGEMFIRHEEEKAEALVINSNLNAQMQQQIRVLRTTYNVEPTIDYALNFPSEEGGLGSFVRGDVTSDSE